MSGKYATQSKLWHAKNIIFSPLRVATYHAEQAWSPEVKVFFDRVVALFEEATSGLGGWRGRRRVRMQRDNPGRKVGSSKAKHYDNKVPT